MTDREPKIGDVIYRKEIGPWGHDHLAVDEDTIELCRELVASGRWVIVDPQPAAEPGPNNEGSNQ